MLNQPKVYNSKGEVIRLSTREQKLADALQRQLINNDLGFEIPITTLTAIVKKITEQKFFEVMPADYLPIRVGEGAWKSSLTTYRTFELAEDFSTGIINLAKNNGRLAGAEAGIDSLSIAIKNWAKTINWTLFELQEAATSGNWDLISSKEKTRKKNWDLGIQKTAFLGVEGDASCLGLLNQAGITSNTALLQVPISSLSPSDLKYFCENILNVYRSNCQRTAWPSHFIIPESDYLGLAGQASADFPIKSTLAVLEETFQTMTKNKGFKILPLAYCDVAYNNPGTTQQQYVMLNYDEESIRMDVPVPYTNTLANSLDNFAFQNVGYGQFTGVLAYRPLELMYLKFTPA